MDIRGGNRGGVPRTDPNLTESQPRSDEWFQAAHVPTLLGDTVPSEGLSTAVFLFILFFFNVMLEKK